MQALQSAAAEGRLSPEEAGERLAAASGATYREELEQLLTDLPVGPSIDPQPRPPRSRLGGWWIVGMARLAFVGVLFAAFWSFVGVRFWLWPFAFLALMALSRRWRRRRWHRRAWAR